MAQDRAVARTRQAEATFPETRREKNDVHHQGICTSFALLIIATTVPVASSHAQGVGYCFGDPGSGTPCPCNNDNDGSVPGSGCDNGVFASGAKLVASGTPSLSADTLVLHTTHLEPNNAGLYFQADNDLSPGIVWGDGLRCAGGNLKRLGVRFSDASGYSDTSGFPVTISAKAGNVMAGDTKYYQCWYRTTVSPPCGLGNNDFNTSNGYAITWSAGTEDITVLVLGDGTTPLDGAVVTLQGTDPSSLSGITLTTAANGTATFAGVAGPYSVTAQFDVVSPDGTIRRAASVIDITPVVTGNPPAGTIGVFLDDLYESYPAVDATLAGTVLNMPTLSGTEYLQVVAVGNGSADFEWGTPVDSMTGYYSMPIPSGTDIDCYIAHRQDYGLPSSPILASLLEPGVGQTGPGTTLFRDFDFGSPEVVPWNLPVGFTATNVHPALSLSIQLIVEDLANGISYDFSFFDGNPGPPFITLPDVTDPSFSAYGIELDADTFDPFGIVDAGQDHSLVLTATPAAVIFDFFSVPSILQPADLMTLTLQELDDLEVQVAPVGTGTFGANGVDIFSLAAESGPPPPGIDESHWVLFLPAGTTSFDLPPYSLPMFAIQQGLECGFDQWRQHGYTFDFDTFFSGNLAANLVALEAMTTEWSSSDVSNNIFIVP